MKAYFLLILISVLQACQSEKTDNKQQLTSPVAVNQPQNIISLSDIHFDPFFDQALFDRLESADISTWESVLNSSTATPDFLDPANDNDTNWFLFKSTLEDIASRAFDPPFVIVTGDFLLHNMQDKFPAGTSSAERLQFTVKTMDFVYQQLEKVFPNTPIYAALGNNDNFAGNYSIKPHGDFLKGIADTWFRSLKTSVDSADFYRNFLARGNYAANATGSNKHRVLSLNSILFFDGYPLRDNPQDTLYTNAVSQQFTWLENELNKARTDSLKVWLIYHIPPGADAYKTARSGKLERNWSDISNKRFISLVNEFNDVITAQFGGHTHKDSFALINDTITGKPVSFIHTTPSISMSNRNYPGYHHVKINGNFEVTDFDAYYLNNAQTHSAAAWQKEYSFLQAYGISEYTPASLNALRTKLNADATLKSQYMDYFNVSYYRPSSSPNISDASWKVYWCAMGHQDFTAFNQCFR